MKKLAYIENFERLGIGLFVHFGLYSNAAKGEWYQFCHNVPEQKYQTLAKRFNPSKNWAKNLVKAAKDLGARYITLTTRHHDGYSLYDTKGLSDYDAMHSPAGRDLIREFTDACREGGIVPFFYHTLLDWHQPSYKESFADYIDYLVRSIELLCTNYGEIGGFWFDGMWDKPNADWQEDRIYSTIRALQPNAMIINNTGLSEQGKVGHFEIDSVTFERGQPQTVDNSDKYRAGEMCQVVNDHWGYAANDCNYKSVRELIENLVDCRLSNCNFLLNVGLKGNGAVKQMDGCILKEIGRWHTKNKGFLYNVQKSELVAENAQILTDGRYYYAVIKGVPMTADPNVTRLSAGRYVRVKAGKKIKNASWLDSGKKIKVEDNSFLVEPFAYGTSLSVRVARFELED